MTLMTLGSRGEITKARQVLKAEGVSFVDGWLVRTLRRRGLWPGISIGHPIKSWDVLATTRFLRDHIKPQDPVLDIGAYTSEILPILHRSKYRSLTGIDLNPRTPNMPFPNSITYIIGDFLTTPLPPDSYAAITAISVIEHGFQPRLLLAALSRLLRIGGYFIASFDYWPEKIDTSSVRMFNMDWRIFSRQEVADFLDEAREFGLEPFGPLQYDTIDPAVHWEGRDYTFGWMVLQKRATMDPKGT